MTTPPLTTPEPEANAQPEPEAAAQPELETTVQPASEAAAQPVPDAAQPEPEAAPAPGTTGSASGTNPQPGANLLPELTAALREAAIGKTDARGPAWTRFPAAAPKAVPKTMLWVLALIQAFVFNWVMTQVTASHASFVVPVLAALFTLPLVAMQRSLLLAWRLLTLSFIVLGLISTTHPWNWPVPGLAAYLLVVFLVAGRLQGPVVVGVTLVSALAVAVAGWRTSLPAIMAVVSLTCLAAVAGLLWRGHGQTRLHLAEANTRLAATNAELDAEASRGAVLAERARIARELHDVVAHHMSMIAIQAEAAPLRVKDLPPEAAQAFNLIRDAAREALAETRGIVGLLRGQEPGEREPAPGLDAIASLVTGAQATGLTVTLEQTGTPPAEPPAAVGLAAYRIVQEALANAARHAPGSPVHVRLDYTSGSVGVTVTNPASRYSVVR
ncbi:MAG: histidine kinase [Bifidobacteriaceae bacterium]|jgi:signal transduction histidine kinase|nr:histidine kinase [Bifidobacteriaceae bacterium]